MAEITLQSDPTRIITADENSQQTRGFYVRVTGDIPVYVNEGRAPSREGRGSQVKSDDRVRLYNIQDDVFAWTENGESAVEISPANFSIDFFPRSEQTIEGEVVAQTVNGLGEEVQILSPDSLRTVSGGGNFPELGGVGIQHPMGISTTLHIQWTADEAAGDGELQIYHDEGDALVLIDAVDTSDMSGVTPPGSGAEVGTATIPWVTAEEVLILSDGYEGDVITVSGGV